jgi:hypothetical protein
MQQLTHKKKQLKRQLQTQNREQQPPQQKQVSRVIQLKKRRLKRR